MIILASRSPRRIEILKNSGYDFKVVESNVIETMNNNAKPHSNAMNIALMKAKDVQTKYPNNVIIAADTIVVFKGEILGKPKDENDAYEMLVKLNNDKHDVITGVVILKGDLIKTFYVRSKVYFKNNNIDDIKTYIATKEPFDKAGSYAIQGDGSKLIDRFKGDYYNIMGLPIKKLSVILKRII